jgi:hypothetical protein
MRGVGGGGGVAAGAGFWGVWVCLGGKPGGRPPPARGPAPPPRVWSRTGDGGMLVRVPPGASAGRAVLSVKQEHGETSAELTVRRYAAVLAGGHLIWVELGGEGPAVAGEITVAGSRFLRISPDGRAAYLAGPDGLLTYELTAPRLPERVARAVLGPAPVVALAGAAAANRLVVVREADLLLYDLSSPLSPDLRQTLPLPPLVRAGKVVRAELSPDGQLLAFALGNGNRVVVAQTDRLASGDAAVRAELSLDRETRAPVLVDLAFAHDGRTLWAVAGDTAESKLLGPQPTRVFALRVGEGGHKLELARTVVVEVAGQPARLSTGRSLPLASGAAVRLPPEKATVYLTAGMRGEARSAVFTIGAQDAATAVAATGGPGWIAGIDVTPEGRWLLAAAVTANQLQLLSAPADGRAGAVRSLTLGAGVAEQPAEVRIQP